MVKLFMPFKPMLSKRHENDFGHIVKLMGTHGNDVKVRVAFNPAGQISERGGEG